MGIHVRTASVRRSMFLTKMLQFFIWKLPFLQLSKIALYYHNALSVFLRLPPSPSHSDVSSLYGFRSPMAPGESVTALASRIHWEQLQLRQNYFQSPTGRRYSPGAVPGTVIILIWASLWQNRSSRFPTRSDTNRAVQPQKMARGLKFRI